MRVASHILMTGCRRARVSGIKFTARAARVRSAQILSRLPLRARSSIELQILNYRAVRA